MKMPAFSGSMLEPAMQHKKSAAHATGISTITGYSMEPVLQKKKVGHAVNPALSATSVEPAMQRKRKPDAAGIASKTFDDTPGDEYILLGDQAKFATNIKYKTKNLKRLASKMTVGGGEKMMVDESQQTAVDRPPRSAGVKERPHRPSRRRPRRRPSPPARPVRKAVRERDVQPPPRAVVDTGAPCLRRAPAADPKPALAPTAGPKPVPAPTAGPKPGPAQTAGAKPGFAQTAGPKPGFAQTAGPKPALAPTAGSKPALAPTAGPKPGPVPAPAPAAKTAASSKQREAMKVKRNNSNNKMVEQVVERKRVVVDVKGEPVRSSLKKDEDAGQKAADNYALRYKAGLTAPQEGRSKMKLSEYQKEFTWKRSIESSPLLAAEQVVYRTNAQLVAPKASGAGPPRSSEYQKEFQPWLMARSLPASQLVKPLRQARRSKSVEGVSRTPAAGKERVTLEGDKRLVVETTTPPTPRLPQTKPRMYRSEYAVNFREPAQYVYENGAWKAGGGTNAQLQAAQGVSAMVSGSPPPPGGGGLQPCPSAASVASSWFCEVQELRRRAHEYKQRAQGTHFGRAHLAQLYAQQAALWDAASVTSLRSTLGVSDASTARMAGEEGEDGEEEGVAPGRRLAWSQTDYADSLPASVTSWKGLLPAAAASTRDAEAGGGDSSSSPQRHHLDRTTPAVGGLLLVNRQPKDRGDGPAGGATDGRSPVADDVTVEVDDELGDAEEDVGEEEGREPADRPDPQKVQKPRPSPSFGVQPAFGVPTRDAHLLMDEEASHDEPLQTEFLQSPLQKKFAVKNAWQDLDTPSNIKEKGDINGRKPNGSNIDWRKLNIGDLADRDDDQRSVSVMSVASSCSLASQVLERARQRRDEFWGHSNVGPSRG